MSACLWWVLSVVLADTPEHASAPRLSSAEYKARCREARDCAGGYCTWRPSRDDPGRCVVEGDADCHLTSECIQEGRCTWNRRTRSCEVRAGDACARSPACSVRGLCAYEGWSWTERGRQADPRCVATEEGCLASFTCRDGYDCGFDAERQQCAAIEPSRPRVHPLPPRFDFNARFGLSTLARPKSDVDGALAARCRDAIACARLGWCAYLPGASESDGGGRVPGVTYCGATDCAASEMCGRFGACTLHDGLCVVERPQPVPEGCVVERVVSLRATAASEMPTRKGVSFCAQGAVDRDARTAWVPAGGGEEEARLLIRLPAPRRIVSIEVETAAGKADVLGDWRRLFDATVVVAVEVGDTRAVGYDSRWMSKGTAISIDLPAVEADLITLTVLMTEGRRLERVPAIPEVRVYACR